MSYIRGAALFRRNAAANRGVVGGCLDYRRAMKRFLPFTLVVWWTSPVLVDTELRGLHYKEEA